MLKEAVDFLLEGQQSRRVMFPAAILRQILMQIALESLVQGRETFGVEEFVETYRSIQTNVEAPDISPGPPQEAFQLFRAFVDRITWIITEVGPGLFRFSQPLFQAFLIAELMSIAGEAVASTS